MMDHLPSKEGQFDKAYLKVIIETIKNTSFLLVAQRSDIPQETSKVCKLRNLVNVFLYLSF